MTTTQLLLALISALLALITGLLGVVTSLAISWGRAFYAKLNEILAATGDHDHRLTVLETYREEHKAEVAMQRAQWDKREADALGQLHALERTVAQLTIIPRENGPAR